MEMFFYSAKTSCDSQKCHWQACSHRYLARLKRTKGLHDIRSIFGKIPYGLLTLDMIPRNGDIVILYAEDSLEIDSLIVAKDGFDGMKKILVLAGFGHSEADKYHMLSPSFITRAERDMAELEAVIGKMTGCNAY